MSRVEQRRARPRPSPWSSWVLPTRSGGPRRESRSPPGGNVTRLATIEWEAFTAKQLQIIKEALPKSLVTVRSLSK
jgi:hypothetical protein